MELASPALDDWLPPRHTVQKPLHTQYLRPIPLIEFQSRQRAIPLEPLATICSEDLTREAEQTEAFLQKQLAKDPKLQPPDLELNFSHMEMCVSCINYRRHWQALHGASSTVKVGTALQLLVDDYVVANWTNVMRFLDGPASKRVVLESTSRDGADDRRFGCPCSAMSWRNGSVKLWHAASPDPKRFKLRSGAEYCRAKDPRCYQPDEHLIVQQRSADGRTDWSAPRQVVLRSKPSLKLKTFVVSGYDAPSRRRNETYYVGLQQDSHPRARGTAARWHPSRRRSVPKAEWRQQPLGLSPRESHRRPNVTPKLSVCDAGGVRGYVRRGVHRDVD